MYYNQHTFWRDICENAKIYRRYSCFFHFELVTSFGGLIVYISLILCTEMVCTLKGSKATLLRIWPIFPTGGPVVKNRELIDSKCLQSITVLKLSVLLRNEINCCLMGEIRISPLGLNGKDKERSLPKLLPLDLLRSARLLGRQSRRLSISQLTSRFSEIIASSTWCFP